MAKAPATRISTLVIRPLPKGAGTKIAKAIRNGNETVLIDEAGALYHSGVFPRHARSLSKKTLAALVRAGAVDRDDVRRYFAMRERAEKAIEIRDEITKFYRIASKHGIELTAKQRKAIARARAV